MARSCVASRALRVRAEMSSQMSGVEAPSWQGEESQEYLAYSEFSERSQVGCFGAKNVKLLLREPLAPEPKANLHCKPSPHVSILESDTPEPCQWVAQTCLDRICATYVICRRFCATYLHLQDCQPQDRLIGKTLAMMPFMGNRGGVADSQHEASRRLGALDQ